MKIAAVQESNGFLAHGPPSLVELVKLHWCASLVELEGLRQSRFFQPRRSSLLSIAGKLEHTARTLFQKIPFSGNYRPGKDIQKRGVFSRNRTESDAR